MHSPQCLQIVVGSRLLFKHSEPFHGLLYILVIQANASAQTPCLTTADKPTPACDGIVSLSEINDHINAWYACSSCVTDLFKAIQAYYGIPFCGDNSCDSGIGEDCSTCVPDCACGSGETCRSGICEALSGNVYYIDNLLAYDCTGGSYSISDRSCTGSDGDAYYSIRSANSVAQPGDTFLFRAGNYTTTRYYSYPARSGAPGNPITYRNYPGERPVIKGTWTAEGSSCTGSAFWLVDRSHIIIDGLEISNYCVCIAMYQNSSFITIRNMLLHDCIYGASIRANSSDILIEDSEGYRNSRYYDGGCGVAARDSSNIVVKNFYSHDNDDLLGNSGDGDGFCTSSGQNMTFINCTAEGNSEDGFDLTGLDVWLINSRSRDNFVNGVKTWRRGTPILLAMKTDVGDAFIGYGVVGKVEQLWELPPEEEAYCQENNWRCALTFKSLFSFENPYPIKESILSEDTRKGSFLHGARLPESQVDTILEAAEDYQG